MGWREGSWVHWLVDGLILCAVIVTVAVITVATDGIGDEVIVDGVSEELADSGGDVAQMADIPGNGLEPIPEAQSFQEQSYGNLFDNSSESSVSESSAGSVDSDHPCTLAGSSMYLSNG